MKLRNPSVWITAVTGIAILGVGIVQGAREAPGPLTSVHGSVAELAGDRSCSACHGGWTSTMAQSCLECHPSVEGQLDHDHGFHGGLDPEQAKGCGLCHAEHHGANFAMVGEQSFTLAGFQGRAGFDHNHVDFAMDGAHLEEACDACHVYADFQVLPDGEQRYGGLSRDCATCHEDPHEGSYVRACADCHTQTSFDSLIAVNHEQHLPLIGAHADVACSTCHEADGSHGLAAIVRKADAPPARGCADCHDVPHASTFLRRIANQTHTTVANSCAECHQAEHLNFADDAAAMSANFHRASGFDLDAPHTDLDCAACHGEAHLDFSERFPGRKANQCVACHEDPHEGQFDASALAPNGCVDCHETTHFAPHAFTLDDHDATSMPLVGSHVQVDCHSCHGADAAGTRAFHGVDSSCETCHDDAHAGHFLSRQAESEPHPEGSCAVCHQPTTFAQVLGFDHTRWTGFPIHGAHEQADCESCHPRSDAADALGRRFGRVEEHFGAFHGDLDTSCVICHADPHGGGFDGPGKPRQVEGRRGCVRCHSESSFRSLTVDFHHGRWTGFPLDGAHAQADCATCHAPLNQADANGRTWSAAAGSACVDCHADPHQAQFLVDGSTDCAKCHAAGLNFRELVFDHDLDARFPLEGAHEDVACAACHSTEAVESAMESALERVTFVRYRPLERECVACHGVNKEALRLRRRKK